MKTPVKIGQRMLPLLGVVIVMGALAAVWSTLGRSQRHPELGFMENYVEVGRASSYVQDPTGATSRKYFGEQYAFKAKFEEVTSRAERFYKSKGFTRSGSDVLGGMSFESRDGQMICIAKGNRLPNSEEAGNADYVSIAVLKKSADFLPRIVTPINQ